MKMLGVMLVLLGSSAFAAQTETVVCEGKTVTGESFELSFCSINMGDSKREQCEGQGVEITVNGKTEQGYYPQTIYIYKNNDHLSILMKSANDGLSRYAEVEYTTAQLKRWNLIRFYLLDPPDTSVKSIEKRYFTAIDFTCDLKP